MAKICLIGAGSTVFAQNILSDVLSNPDLADSEIALMDIDVERLSTSEIMARRIGDTLGLKDLKIASFTDRRGALKGSDFVILMMQVGGYKPATVTDFEVPKEFGLRQTIADTLGIGGIFRALRTIPVIFDIARDMRDVCPDALMMNYVNPMAMNSWAMAEAFPDIRYVGLCHSVQDTSNYLARSLGEDIADIDFRCAGLNHVAFFTKFEKRHKDGRREDLYPRLRAKAESGDYDRDDAVRWETMKHFGHFVTESSIHFSEYTPWFIKRGREDLLAKYQLPLDEYITRCEDQIADWHVLRKELEDAGKPLEVCRSNEYASAIIHGMVTGTNYLIYGNVRNNGLIDNLPTNAAVEVPCHVDRNGIQPVRVGSVPPQLAGIMRMSLNVQELTVQAALTGRRDHIYHAAALDPHTGAELSLDEIRALCDKLIAAHGNYLPAYR
ncbi:MULTISPECIES: alpha-glucosidase/alpha-galactosidase [unclassified Rhizobium]|uniref:alpha-glucosidase/alpha-galactosidase n=1 Tax=unclassified Rhizobium TaxID=2613769 RepID=UPI000713FFC7|nr:MULTISPECIES: alpha-glucosidase/alpha-galactosidase [unclassified Rhizobium]KQS82347.1 alpha-glucosidase/alpha-galactosidase [Rhizobium sp. Leaf386]KQT02694.1 alpha-glucosidase/alpha-galactosidase [Rhizobium sp. Leaf391]KQU03413.1 alpha-glucosidase/alpha-galactosidase [Rhizobium sp. Leaf453]